MDLVGGVIGVGADLHQGAPPAVDRVVAVAAEDQVAAAAAVELVLPAAAIDFVVAAVAIDVIDALSGVDRVVAAVAVDLVGAAARVDRVGMDASRHDVVTAIGLDQRALRQRAEARGTEDIDGVAAGKNACEEFLPAAPVRLVDAGGRK